MPILTACCCWESLRKGSRGSAVFTGVTGIINIIIDIWMLVWLHRLDRNLEDHEKFIFLPPGILPLIYIELFVSLGLVGLAFVLWIGINYGYDGKRMVFGWVYYTIGSRVYEFFIMVYVLVWIGGHRVMDIVYVVPESLGITIYWILDTVVLIAAILCVISYWQELLDTIHGKERRARYFTKLSNIRSAAFGSGTTTPMRSLYASRAYLGASQPSIAQFSQRSVPPSMPPSMPPSAPQSAQPMGPGAFSYPPPGAEKGPPPHGGPYRGPPPGEPYRGPPGGPYRGPPPRDLPPQRGGPPPNMPPQRGGPYPPGPGRGGPPPQGRPPPQRQAVQQYFDEPPPKR